MAIKKLPSTGDAPRTTGAPASLVAGGAADSAGFPWAGRTFEHHETAFAGDDGATPEALTAGLRRLRDSAENARGSASGSSELADLARVHADALLTLSGCRVLIPLLAEAGDLGRTPEGRLVEKTQELSIVTVAAPDGRRVMPVFSSVDTMRAWNPEARPIPVPMPQAAVAAAQEQTDLIIVDPGTPQSEIGVRRTQLEAVAMARRAVLPWADGSVRDAFECSVAGDSRVKRVSLLPGDPEGRLLAPELDVVLELESGLEQDALGEMLTALQQRWAANAAIAERVDSLRIRLVRS